MPACPGPLSPSAASPPARLLAPTRLAVNGSLGFLQRPSEKLGARRRAPPPDRPAPGHRKITGCPPSEWGELRVPRSVRAGTRQVSQPVERDEGRRRDAEVADQDGRVPRRRSGRSTPGASYQMTSSTGQ